MPVARKTVKRGTISYQTEVQGNVVRKLHPAPNHQERINEPAEAPGKHHRQVKNTLSVPYCVFLALVSVLTLILGAYYLEQQALSASSQKKIASLEKELTELKKSNTDDLNSIEMSVKLDEIRDIAINKLGMVYASEENVVLYKNTKQNYVSQYNEIPREEESLVKSMMKSK